MIPILTAFDASPDRGRGLARDTRVRWALEEVGQPYEVRYLSFAELKEPAHRALQPFGQIPTYEKGDLALWETGAIVLHIAETHAGLLPKDRNARAQTIAWMFAALSSVEPWILEIESTHFHDRGQAWGADRLAQAENRLRVRLDDLDRALGDKNWLMGEFTAADILMCSVLLRVKGEPVLDERPRLAAYLARGEARPAYQRSFAAQLEHYQRRLEARS